jgi:hypothetical protein
VKTDKFQFPQPKFNPLLLLNPDSPVPYREELQQLEHLIPILLYNIRWETLDLKTEGKVIDPALAALQIALHEVGRDGTVAQGLLLVYGQGFGAVAGGLVERVRVVGRGEVVVQGLFALRGG